MRRWLERLLDPGAVIAHRLQNTVVDPATRFLTTTIESFGPPITAIVIATLLQASLPDASVSCAGSSWGSVSCSS